MSQIRRLKISLRNEESVITACENLGMSVSWDKNTISLENHDLETYGRGRVYLSQKNEEWEMSADCSKKELEKFGIKIKKEYSQIVLEKAAMRLGLTQTGKTSEKDKIKLTFTAF